MNLFTLSWQITPSFFDEIENLSTIQKKMQQTCWSGRIWYIFTHPTAWKITNHEETGLEDVKEGKKII